MYSTLYRQFWCEIFTPNSDLVLNKMPHNCIIYEYMLQINQYCDYWLWRRLRHPHKLILVFSTGHSLCPLWFYFIFFIEIKIIHDKTMWCGARDFAECSLYFNVFIYLFFIVKPAFVYRYLLCSEPRPLLSSEDV